MNTDSSDAPGDGNRVVPREIKEVVVTIVTVVLVVAALFLAAYLLVPLSERLLRWLFQTRFIGWLTRVGERSGGKGE
jgi:uncharacterized membrane protein YbhN (UPF0104 family)